MIFVCVLDDGEHLTHFFVHRNTILNKYGAVKRQPTESVIIVLVRGDARLFLDTLQNMIIFLFTANFLRFLTSEQPT